MSSPLVVWNVPLVVEGKGKGVYNEPMTMDESGFPFDKNFDRDRERPFRSKLDDIAKRHPEFAEHLKFGEGGGLPPFRSNLRERWGAEGDPSGSQDPFEEYRRFERPFGDRFPFTNRGFPAEGAEFGPSHFQQQQPPPQQQQQPPPEAAQEQPRQKETPRQAPVHERKLTNPNLIQSNTVDLGQKQEPVDEKRNQRSMSAPPENRNPQQRFVSTCNIPVNADATPGEAQQQEQPKPQQQQGRTHERVIPIHVEGRDVPVVPKNVHQTFTPPPPQPERVFGNKPTFPQYFNRDNMDRPFGSPTEEMFRQPYFRGHPQQQQRPQSPTTFQKQPQQTPPPQQQQKPAPPPQQQPQQQQQPPPQPQPKTAIDHIQAIQKDVLALMDDVEKFTGKYKDKQYLYLDEMLTRNLLKLDNIDTEGKDNIRTARKEAIRCIEKCISHLEAKAAANSPELQQQLQQRAAEEKMEVDPATSEEKPQQQSMEAEPIKALEVSGVARSGTQANVPENPEVPKEEAPAPQTTETPQQQMEVADEKKPESEVKQQEAIPLPPPPEHKEAANPETEEKEEKPKDKKKGKKKEKVEKK